MSQQPHKRMSQHPENMGSHTGDRERDFLGLRPGELQERLHGRPGEPADQTRAGIQGREAARGRRKNG